MQGGPRLPKQPFAGPDEPKDDGKVKGHAQAVYNLDDRLVQPKCDPDDEAQESGCADDGEQSARAADRQGQGDLFGGDALSQLMDNGFDDASFPK
jgi:hypothetical protein